MLRGDARLARCLGRLVGCVLVIAGCRGEPADPTPLPAPEADSLARAAAEEIQIELDILRHEIADLEAYVASARFPQDSAPRLGAADPGPLLERARRSREAAQRLAAAGNFEAAADSLTTSAHHVEQVKRTLGLAEEWGEDLPD